MNIELAKTFLEVVASGSLARAADRLHVTHSTVTMRLKTLEEILRCRVLVRSKAGVSLTPAGNKFLRYAEILVRNWQLTRRQLALGPGFDEIFSVGADTLLWDDLMFHWATKTRQLRSNVALRCECGASDYLIRRLLQGWLDVCVVYEAPARKGLAVEKLFDDPLILVGTENRRARKSWDRHYVEIDWDESYRAQDEQYWGIHNETPHISVDNGPLGIRFLMEFGGTSWIPKRVLENGHFARPLFRLEGSPEYTRIAYLVYSEEAMQEKLSNISLKDLGQSIVNVLHKNEPIWPEQHKSK